MAIGISGDGTRIVDVGSATTASVVPANNTATANGLAPASPAIGNALVGNPFYDPISGKWYVQTSATADGMNPQTVDATAVGVLNGSGAFDRLRGDTGRLTTTSHDLLLAVLIELRVMNNILAEGLNVQTDLDSWRSDPSLDIATPGAVN